MFSFPPSVCLCFVFLSFCSCLLLFFLFFLSSDALFFPQFLFAQYVLFPLVPSLSLVFPNLVAYEDRFLILSSCVFPEQ
jgi:hypothetical protein